jgi:hypothetical protein
VVKKDPLPNIAFLFRSNLISRFNSTNFVELKTGFTFAENIPIFTSSIFLETIDYQIIREKK